ncbi:MAG: YihY/virulence factor BrkB family protein [Actinomycetota bacterium]
MNNDTIPSAKRIEEGVARRIAALYQALRRNRLTRLPWAVIQTFSEAEGALLSGSMAYYTFLSLLPLLMITGFVIGTLSEYNLGVQEAVNSGLERFLPGSRSQQFLEQLIRSRVAFGIVGLGAVVYAGSGFVGALTACLNQMWGVPGDRNPVGQKLFNVLVVILLGVVLLGSAAVTLWVSFVTEVVLGSAASPLLQLIEVVGSPLSLFLVILLLYRLLPAVDMSWRRQVPGAAFGALGIEVLKNAFALWARYSAGVAFLPRSLLSVVLLLLWMGFFGQIILYGAALNVVLDRKRHGRPLFPVADRPG